MIVSKRRATPAAAVIVLVTAALLAGQTSTPAEANPAKVLPSWSPFPLPKTQSVGVRKVTHGRKVEARSMRSATQPMPAWPSAGSTTVKLSATSSAKHTARGGLTLARAGVLTPKRSKQAPSPIRTATPAAVTVATSSRRAALKAGVDGELFTINARAAASKPTSFSLAIDYAAIASAYGGDYGSRLHLVQLPECALTTPTRAACRLQTPVSGAVNDPATQTLAADVTTPTDASTSPAKPRAQTASPAIVLAASSAPSSGAGSYSATSLTPSGSWSVGGNTGAFTYSYPFTAPPAVGGDAPNIGLSYDSASVDGRTSSTNSQASWIGDGWDYSPGFIERRYKNCSDDGHPESGDECWAGDNATISWNGHNTRLVPTGSGNQWRMETDDGSIIDQVSGASNGLNGGTYWRVTTNDGIRYYFGADHLPTSAGGNGSDDSTDAAWGLPVYGDDAGEPCHGADLDHSSCTQGWRWNLDFVVDPHQNVTTYHYKTETNYYAAGTTHTAQQYVRAGVPTSVTYGQQVSDYLAGLPAAARVQFTSVQRCDPSGGFDCSTAISDANASHWPDVPYDQHCDSGSGCTNYTPTFWSQLALSSVTTQIWDRSQTTPAWHDVDAYQLKFSFPDTGGANPDGGGTEAPPLWLDSITRTGKDTDGGGSAVNLDAVSFTGTSLPNRAAGSQINGVPPIYRFRILTATTETGANTSVDYDISSGCDRNSPPAEDNDTTRCYPVRWTPFGFTDPVLDWFTTYPVTEVDQNDNNNLWGGSGSPSQITHYNYSSPRWHRDDSELTPTKNRTWDQFRGYGQVTAKAGNGSDPITQTTTDYLQGMGNDANLTGPDKNVSITDDASDIITDRNIWSGFAYQTKTYASSGGALQHETVKHPWASNPTATQTRTGLPSLYSRYIGTDYSDQRSLLSDGSWRVSRTATTFDDTTGLTQTVDDLGAVNPTTHAPLGGTTPERCTKTSYAADASRNMLAYPDLVVTTAGACTSSISAATLSATRTYYDNGALGALTGPGNPTSTQQLKAASTATWAAAATASFDGHGRITATADPLNRTGATTYSAGADDANDAKYLPTTIVATNAKGWKTTTTLDPARQLSIATSDPNGRITTANYDGLGRLTQAWMPNNPQAGNPSTPSLKFAYAVSRSAYVSTTTSTLHDDGHYSLDVKISDSMLQPRQEQSSPMDGSAGTRMIANTRYDSHGWTVISDAAFYNNAAAPKSTPVTTIDSNTIPSETRTTYDGRGRPVSSGLYYNGMYQWATTTGYPGEDLTNTTPPAGAYPTAVITDARGQQVEQRALRPTTSTIAYDYTSYGYDAAGRNTSITGPLAKGAVPDSSTPKWTTQYDALDNTTRTTDPDVGTTTNTYDDDSEMLTTSTTGLETGDTATTLVYSYDNLGRQLDLRSAGTIGPLMSQWSYDPTGTNGAKGQPASSTEYAANGTTITYTDTVAGYTTDYQPTGDTITVPASSYNNTSAVTYTRANIYTPTKDLLDTQKITEGGPGALMAAESVGYTYNPMGLPGASGGLSSMETNTNYDPHGRVIRGVAASQPTQAAVTYSWDEPTGRLLNATTNKQTGTAAVDNTTYTYNPAGAITSTTDIEDGGTAASGRDRQCFTYDYLQRLTNAWTDTSTLTSPIAGAPTAGGIGSCSDAAPANLGGPAPYRQAYDYGTDLTGNRLTTTNYAVSGGAAATTTTKESYSGLPTAHAVHSTSSVTGSTTTATTYAYNAGRTISSVATINGTAQPAQTRAMTWTAAGRMASLKIGTATTSYGYDPDGNEIARVAGTGTTLYLGNDTITLTSGSITKVVRAYPFPGSFTTLRVDTSTTNNGTVYFEAGNPQGTQTTTLTATTLAVARRAYTPFGETRTTTNAGTWPGDGKTFLDAPADSSSGLVDLGARQYDPGLGRFESADPVLDPSTPQQLNGYSYSGNDPVDFFDPDGRDWHPPGRCMSDDPICNNRTGGTDVHPGDPSHPCDEYACRTHNDGHAPGTCTGCGTSSKAPAKKCAGLTCRSDHSHNFNQQYHQICDPLRCDIVPIGVNQIEGDEYLYKDRHAWWCAQMTTCDPIAVGGLIGAVLILVTGGAAAADLPAVEGVAADTADVVVPKAWNASTELPSGGTVRGVGNRIWGRGTPDPDRLAGMTDEQLRGLASLNDAKTLNAMYRAAGPSVPNNATAPLRVKLSQQVIDAWGRK